MNIIVNERGRHKEQTLEICRKSVDKLVKMFFLMTKEELQQV